MTESNEATAKIEWTGKCHGYKCNCTAGVFSGKRMNWDYCECLHTMQCHERSGAEAEQIDPIEPSMT